VVGVDDGFADGSGSEARLQCFFCGRPDGHGVAGQTPDIFACDECIALMVNIRRTERRADTWPPTD